MSQERQPVRRGTLITAQAHHARLTRLGSRRISVSEARDALGKPWGWVPGNRAERRLAVRVVQQVRKEGRTANV